MHIPPNPFPHGSGFSTAGFAVLMGFVCLAGGFMIWGIKMLGEMIP